MNRRAVFMDVPAHMSDRDVEAMLNAELPRLFGVAPDVSVYSREDDLLADLEAGTEAITAA